MRENEGRPASQSSTARVIHHESEELETAAEEAAGPRIAVVGMSCRFPGAGNPAELWRNLRGGVDAITRFADDELAAAGVDPGRLADPAYVKAAGVVDGVESFDAGLFGFSPREAELLDPQHRLLLECAWEALEDAGYAPGATRDKVGVFAGASYPAYLLDHVHPTLAGADFATAYAAVLANDKDFLATRIAYKLDLRGPSLTVGTACSTSLVAVCQACASLAIGDCDAALAGGVTVRLPQRAGYLYQEDGILSPDGRCRAFDAAARGTVPGSGAGMVLLKRLDDALAAGDTVRAVIRGWAVNNDGGERAGFTAPRAESQAEVVLEALALARVRPETISYVEAHGTGTPIGDPIELRALRRAFGAAGDGRHGGCGLGSVKTNLGHLDAAAGVAGLVKTVLCLEHRELVPSLHFERANPELELEASPFRVVTERAEWTSDGAPLRAGVSSFGIGGTNAHVVLEEAPRPASRPSGKPGPELLVLSAATETALARHAANLARHLREHPELDPADVAFTLRLGRKPLVWRRTAVRDGLEDMAAALEEEVRAAQVEPGHRPVAFLFPGQGAQRVAMAAELHRRGGAGRRELERCLEVLGRHLGPERSRELRSLLLEAPRTEDARQAAAERLAHTALAQPALFAVEYALARQWMSWGIEPEAMLGHSVGELVAACLAEVFTLDDALAVVAARGALVGELGEGAMLAVPLAEEDLRPRLDGLSLAAVNGPALCAVSGGAAEIDAVAERLRAEGLESRRLVTSHAFHSPHVEPALDAFRAAVSRVERRPPRRRFLSNVTGTWITAEQATDPDYWCDHLRRTVRFAPAVVELLAEPRRVFLEVGPGAGLSALVRKHSEARERTVVASLSRPGEDSADGALLEAAGELWLAGVVVDWEAFDGGGARRVPLPTYPFEGRRCWIEARDPGAAAPSGNALVKKTDPADWFSLPTWKRTLPAGALASASDVDGAWLLLGDGGGLATRLAEELRRRGKSVIAAADHDQLLAVLEKDGDPPRGFVSLLGVGDAKTEPRGDLRGLLDLVRAVASRLGGGTARVFAVTDGLWEVTGGEARDPARAAAAGLLKVVPQEVPGVVCRTIDLAPNEDRAGELAAELASGSTDPVVALRGGHRWQLVYDPVRLPEPADALRPRQGGHYLVTGGLGRFGLALAEHLAGRHGARLTLLDRRRPTAEETERLAALGDAGAEIAVTVELDVADREPLRRAVAAAVERWGEPDGVIHAAGAPADVYKSLFEVGADELEEHLRPKLEGARALDDVFAEVLGPGPPIPCHATTSLASVLGGVGLTPYVTADAVLDAYAQSRPAAGRTKWMSVNWEGWQQIEAHGLAAVEQQNALAMTAEEVAEAFERLHALDGPTRMVAATGDLGARLAQSAARKSAPAVAPGSSAPYRAPSDPVEARIAEVWQEVLGVDRVGADDDFFLLGGDSLNGLQVLSKLRAELDVELPLESFFEARTVAGMAAVVAAEKQPAEIDDERMAALLAEIEELSDEETQALLEHEAGGGG